LKVREGFYGFDIDKLSKATIAELVKRPGVYNNEKKVEAIIANARKFQEIRQNFGSFSNFLKSLKRLKDRDAIKQITKQFKHVGEYTAEYYLHSIGYWK
jgi:DNA-3-methyladenine glycosylase I